MSPSGVDADEVGAGGEQLVDADLVDRPTTNTPPRAGPFGVPNAESRQGRPSIQLGRRRARR